MSSGLIILIGFGISAILMLTVWLTSKNTREKNLNLSGIEKQKTEIIDIIERAVGESQKVAKPRQQTSVNGGMPVWGKWFMALSVVPLIGSFVMASVQGQGGNKAVTVQTTTTANVYTPSMGIDTTTTIPTSITYIAGTNPDAICFDGSNIWVANANSNNITKLRVSDGYTLGTYMAVTDPKAICFDGSNIWVANNQSNTVTKLTITQQ
jgi:hypothetical protein